MPPNVYEEGHLFKRVTCLSVQAIVLALLEIKLTIIIVIK